jgi:hypothetical protein
MMRGKTSSSILQLQFPQYRELIRLAKELEGEVLARSSDDEELREEQ